MIALYHAEVCHSPRLDVSLVSASASDCAAFGLIYSRTFVTDHYCQNFFGTEDRIEIRRLLGERFKE